MPLKKIRVLVKQGDRAEYIETSVEKSAAAKEVIEYIEELNPDLQVLGVEESLFNERF